MVMSALQYAYCVLYAIFALGLIAVVAMQQGEDNGAIKSLSGGYNDSYYAKNMAYSPETKKKLATALLAVGFIVLTAASNFVLP